MRNRKQTFIERSDDYIATWLLGELREGKMTRDDIESEALEYDIDPSAVQAVVEKNDMFGSSGKEEWYLTRQPRRRVRLDAIEIDETDGHKPERAGFFF